MPEGEPKKERVAVPSSRSGGLKDRCSRHFGKCQTFTLLDLLDEDIINIEVIKNPDHRSGSCMKLIGILKENSVDTILVGGMGRMAFKVCADLGITVYYGLGKVNVEKALKCYLNGELKTLTHELACNNDLD